MILSQMLNTLLVLVLIELNLLNQIAGVWRQHCQTHTRQGRVILYNRFFKSWWWEGNIATLGPILKSQPSWRSEKSQVARWAKKWYDYPTRTTHPPTQPPILINGIYLQTLIRSYSTFELKLRGPNQSAQRFQMKMPSNFFQIEDYLKL
jgi:hypothetical protein